MRMQRGKSKEADKLIDLLDHGVRDAIDKGFLKQLVLAIFVDPDDATNVIETYTFNFTYSTVDVEADDGSTTTARVPALEIRDELRNLSLGGNESTDSTSKKRKRSSLGETKRQVQLLTKRCARTAHLPLTTQIDWHDAGAGRAAATPVLDAEALLQ